MYVHKFRAKWGLCKMSMKSWVWINIWRGIMWGRNCKHCLLVGVARVVRVIISSRTRIYVFFSYMTYPYQNTKKSLINWHLQNILLFYIFKIDNIIYLTYYYHIIINWLRKLTWLDVMYSSTNEHTLPKDSESYR